MSRFAEQLARARHRTAALPDGFFAVTRPLVTTQHEATTDVAQAAPKEER